MPAIVALPTMAVLFPSSTTNKTSTRNTKDRHSFFLASTPTRIPKVDGIFVTAAVVGFVTFVTFVTFVVFVTFSTKPTFVVFVSFVTFVGFVTFVSTGAFIACVGIGSWPRTILDFSFVFFIKSFQSNYRSSTLGNIRYLQSP